MFRNGITKNTRSSSKGTMNDGTPLSSSDSEMTSKVKKNRRATFEEKLIYVFILLKSTMMHFLRIGQNDLLCDKAIKVHAQF